MEPAEVEVWAPRVQMVDYVGYDDMAAERAVQVQRIFKRDREAATRAA